MTCFFLMFVLFTFQIKTFITSSISHSIERATSHMFISTSIEKTRQSSKLFQIMVMTIEIDDHLIDGVDRFYMLLEELYAVQ